MPPKSLWYETESLVDCDLPENPFSRGEAVVASWCGPSSGDYINNIESLYNNEHISHKNKHSDTHHSALVES